MKKNPYFTFSYDFELEINSDYKTINKSIYDFLKHSKRLWRSRESEFVFMNKPQWLYASRLNPFIFIGRVIDNYPRSIVKIKARIADPHIYFFYIFIIICPVSIFFIPRDNFFFPLNIVTRIILGIMVDSLYYLGMLILYKSKISFVKEDLKRIKNSIENQLDNPQINNTTP